MRRIYIASIITILGGMQANAVQHSINMSAQVQGVCSIGTPNSLNGFATGTSFVATTTNGKANAKTANMRLPFNCNSTGVSLKLTSDKQGITKTISPVPNGQFNKIHYIARTSIGSSPVLASLDTSAASVSSTVNNATASGEITLEIEVGVQPGGTTTLVPGNDYSDVLRLDVDPFP